MVGGMSPDPAPATGPLVSPERADRDGSPPPEPLLAPSYASTQESPEENAMTGTTATLAEAAEMLSQTATRLQRVGLVVDRNALSPAHRRAAFVLQCRAARGPEAAPPRPSMGFAYPPARPRPTDPGQETVPTESARQPGASGPFPNEIRL